MTFSLIIPVLNAGHCLPSCLQSIPSGLRHDVLVVDGGSTDETVSVAVSAGARLLRAGPGRGQQLIVGAQAARGDVLIFLHADTHLPDNAFHTLTNAFKKPSVQIGTFKLRFDREHWLLNFYAWCTRFDFPWTRFGDQGIVIRRSLYESLGGFPAWPLFEDVGLLQKARQRAVIHSFPGSVVTSADKFVKNGYVRQQMRNALLMYQFLKGVSPEVLYQKYYS